MKELTRSPIPIRASRGRRDERAENEQTGLMVAAEGEQMAKSGKGDEAELAVGAPLGHAMFGPLEATTLAGGFAALGDPVRLHLLSLIAAHPDDGVCVCDLVGPVGRSQPTVSHHLKVLRQAGLVLRERRGTWAWYRPVPERLAQLRAVLF